MFVIYDIIKITKINVLSFSKRNAKGVSKKNLYIFLEKYWQKKNQNAIIKLQKMREGITWEKKEVWK